MCTSLYLFELRLVWKCVWCRCYLGTLKEPEWQCEAMDYCLRRFCQSPMSCSLIRFLLSRWLTRLPSPISWSASLAILSPISSSTTGRFSMSKSSRSSDLRLKLSFSLALALIICLLKFKNITSEFKYDFSFFLTLKKEFTFFLVGMIVGKNSLSIVLKKVDKFIF